MLRNIKDQVAIVTGCTGGIGPQIALALARAGVGHIVLAQRREATETVQAIEAVGGKATSMHLDLSTGLDGVQKFFVEFDRRFDSLTHLVNCAGICPRTAIKDVTPKELDDVMQVNFYSPVWMMREARQRQWKSGGGSVTNVLSVVVFTGGVACTFAYPASKMALQGASKNFSQWGYPDAAYAESAEVAKNPDPADPAKAIRVFERFPLIRYNCVAPGPVDTEMMKSMSPAAVAGLRTSARTKQLATPGNVASLTVFLALHAENVTGETWGGHGGIV